MTCLLAFLNMLLPPGLCLGIFPTVSLARQQLPSLLPTYYWTYVAIPSTCPLKTSLCFCLCLQFPTSPPTTTCHPSVGSADFQHLGPCLVEKDITLFYYSAVRHLFSISSPSHPYTANTTWMLYIVVGGVTLFWTMVWWWHGMWHFCVTFISPGLRRQLRHGKMEGWVLAFLCSVLHILRA